MASDLEPFDFPNWCAVSRARYSDLVSNEVSEIADDRGELDGAAQLVLKLIDFLADYDATKNPPVFDIDSYNLFVCNEEQLPDAPGIELNPGASRWLQLDFLELPSKPTIPAELVSILPESGEITPHAEPEIADLEIHAGTGPDGGDRRETLVAQAELWITDSWQPWAEEYKAVARSKAFYRQIFEQGEKLNSERQSVELMWGFGRVSWSTDGKTVNYPLLAVPVEVTRNGANQQLSVAPAGALEVQTLTFAGVELDDRAGLNRIRDSVAENPPDPWSDETVNELRSIVRALHMNGVVDGEAQAAPGFPSVDTGWVLFMRRKRPDYQGFLDKMRELYRAGNLPPAPLQSVVVDEPSLFGNAGSLPATESLEGTSGGEDEPLLLPLPANEEQIRILELAQRRAGVTVQGPPGTGKSHTIANLLSHYVANGQRVLVVAEKEQALRVLSEKVPKEIRDLTVSVLGADGESRKALEGAITQIQARVGGLDKRAFDREIVRLTDELAGLDAEIAVTSDRLLRSRRSEVDHLPGSWLAGNDPTPQAAAAWVAQHESQLGLIPDRIGPDQNCPVASEEIAELLRLIDSVGVDRANECAFQIPELSKLPEPSALAEDLTRFRQIATQLIDARPEVKNWDKVDQTNRDAIAALLSKLREEVAVRRQAEQGWLGAIAEQIRDSLLRAEWENFVGEMKSDRELILTQRGALTSHTIEVPSQAEPAFAQQLVGARQMFEGKGKLGIFASSAKKAIAQCTIDNRTPSSAQDVSLCLTALQVATLRSGLRTRWQNQTRHLAPPELPEHLPENQTGEHLVEIESVLAQAQRWAELASALTDLGIDAPHAADTATVERMVEIVELADAHHTQTEIGTRVDGLTNYLHEGSLFEDASTLWGALEGAVLGSETQRYAELRSQAAGLADIAPRALRLRQISKQIASVAPLLAEYLLAGHADNLFPQNVNDAWQWRQLDTWVRAVAGGDSPSSLQQELESLATQRRRIITQLVGKRAWRRLADNLGDNQRQALNAYMKANKRFGKTGGKYAARWLEEIRRALNDSKDAVPVWIMTTAKALTSFRPEAIAPFDVLIIDEASQIGMEATPLLSLARKAIVVGDDKQTSPENVGLKREEIFNLLDDHLAGIKNYKILFDPDQSLYDMAQQKFPDVVMLTEHFRCLPPIIEFSSRFAYNNRIEALRDRPPMQGWMALGTVKVADGYRVGDVNEPEANAVVDLVARMVEDPDYAGMDFGVVSLLAGKQSDKIREKLFEKLGPQIITERRIRVGEAANFQGDERDVIVVCTVVATDPAKPGARIGAMTSLPAERRLNVAASRAKEQMWIVHSLEPDAFPLGDPRAELIRHCRNPQSSPEAAVDLFERCDSEFERDVIRVLLKRGYRKIDVQHRVGTENHSYRIDIVVEGPESRLAVECDGDRWHGEERWHADRARQEVLERAGWTFERIRGSSFYRDPENALVPLWHRLDDMAIPTGDEWIHDVAARHSQQFEVRGMALESNPDAGAVGVDDAKQSSNHDELEPERAIPKRDGVKEEADISDFGSEIESRRTSETDVEDNFVSEELDGVAPLTSEASHDSDRPASSAVEASVAGRDTGMVDGDSVQPGGVQVNVPIPDGWRQIGWIRSHEAAAAIRAYDRSESIDVIDPSGSLVGKAMFHESNTEPVVRFRANVELQRNRPSGPRTVCWLKEHEAQAIIRAVITRHDVETSGGYGKSPVLVQYFPSGSAEASTYRSTTRLYRLRSNRS